MSNHPSRAWRHRAHAAADDYLRRIAQDRPELAALAAQAERIIRAVFLDGYAAGRRDGKPPRQDQS